MGIERFYASISKSKITRRGVTLDERIKMECNYFYIDFNSIVYTMLSHIEREINKILYSIIINEKHSEYFEKWKFSFDSTIEDFQKYFDNELVTKELVKRVKDFVFDIIDKRIITKELETIYVSFDGIPQMSKAIEQRQRRYMGYLISRLNKKIYKENLDKLPEIRKIFENNKKSFGGANFLYGPSGVMKIIFETFISDEVVKNFKSKYKLKRYIVSPPSVYGEAEKKIMEDIMEHSKSGKYVIYSPDADLIILGMVLQNLLTNNNIKVKINILRHVQQENIFVFIDIQTFLVNIINFCRKYIKSFDESKVSNDLTFLFTLFGNDFVPKIESINVNNNIETIIIKYCEIFDGNYIIYSNPYKINYDVLMKFFKKIMSIEKKLLRETYMSTTYINYNYLKNKVFDTQFLLDSLKEYTKTANDMFDKKNIDSEYKKYFRSIERNNSVPQLKLEKFEKITDDGKISQYHKENIKNSLVHPEIKITDYDVNIYMLERKMGLYEKKLKIDTHDVGKVVLKIKDNRYELLRKKIPENLDEIYLGKNKDKIIKKYIKGLFWVFNFYFNTNDKKTNRKYISTWFYKGHVAPSLKGIYNFMKKNKNNLDKYFNSYHKNVIEISNYINELEHYLYVTPLELQKNVPSQYDEVRNKIFSNLDEIADDIWNEIEPKRIDCTYSIFINKCELTTIKKLDFKTYMKYMLPLREEKIKNGNDIEK
jgi:5'-3' exonuclease